MIEVRSISSPREVRIVVMRILLDARLGGTPSSLRPRDSRVTPREAAPQASSATYILGPKGSRCHVSEEVQTTPLRGRLSLFKLSLRCGLRVCGEAAGVQVLMPQHRRMDREEMASSKEDDHEQQLKWSRDAQSYEHLPRFCYPDQVSNSGLSLEVLVFSVNLGRSPTTRHDACGLVLIFLRS